jgi:hypothetical protein
LISGADAMGDNGYHPHPSASPEPAKSATPMPAMAPMAGQKN